MKTPSILSFVALCFFTISGHAQTTEFSAWYFGNHAGIDFSSGSPVAIDLDSSSADRPAIATDEGCATISGSEGELLFYTDGVKIWNSDHAIMDCQTGACNGNSVANAMGGGLSSTQSAVIVQMPGSSTKYYVFTVSDRYNCTYCPMKIYYSIVDMGAGLKNGSLGKVTKGPVLLDDMVTERAAVVKSTNSSGAWSGGYWVLTHKWSNTGTRDFIAWGISSSGTLDTTGIVSATNDGASIKSNYQAGVLKASGDIENPMLAMAIENYENVSGAKGRVDIYNFDNHSGQVSGLVSSFPLYDAYGAEFSPNGKYLYVSQRYGDKSIYRYDLTASDIPQSQKFIVQRNHWERGYGALQLGPDGHIYTTQAQSMVVCRIKDPNADSSTFEDILTYKSTGIFIRDGLPSPVYVNGNTTSLTEPMHAEYGVFLYPNPARDRVTLTTPGANIRGISLIDITGKEIYSADNISAPRYSMDVSGYNSGLYLIRITSEAGAVTTKKLLVE